MYANIHMGDGIYPIALVIDALAPRKECSSRGLVEHSLMIYEWFLLFLYTTMEDSQQYVSFKLFGPLAKNFCHTGDANGRGGDRDQCFFYPPPNM